jgi:choline dehydrogenase
VLASRLSSYCPQSSILVIEAGPEKDPRITPTLGLSGVDADEIKWKFQTVPQKGLDDKILNLVQGKILGGSSAVNFQFWTRGAAGDL